MINLPNYQISCNASPSFRRTYRAKNARSAWRKFVTINYRNSALKPNRDDFQIRKLPEQPTAKRSNWIDAIDNGQLGLAFSLFAGRQRSEQPTAEQLTASDPS